MAGEHAAGRPFFAFVNDVEPHTPYDPPRDFARSFLAPGLAPGVVQEARLVHLRRSLVLGLGAAPLPDDLRRAIGDLYDAEIAALDDEIGRLVERMRAGGFLDETLVVIVGDHGEGLGDHGWIEHGVRLDRELLRVPLLVRFPRARDAGRRVREVVRLADVLGTILEEAGADAPRGTGATTLLRGLGERIALGRERAFDEAVENAARATSEAAAAPMRRVRRSAYDGRFHLLDEEDAPLRLFDVVADPGETRDVAAEHPDAVTRLHALLPH
jgi:arylsulfatase A-like enzyme